MAYEVLADPEKREVYDDGGESAIKKSGGTETGPMSFFESFMGAQFRME